MHHIILLYNISIKSKVVIVNACVPQFQRLPVLVRLLASPLDGVRLTSVLLCAKPAKNILEERVLIQTFLNQK